MSVNSIQRGVYTGAGGDITISAIDITKSVVATTSKGSSGTAAIRGSVTGTLTPIAISQQWKSYGPTFVDADPATLGVWANLSGTRIISGGTTDLTTKHNSAVISTATKLTADGPCEWQVIEYS